MKNIVFILIIFLIHACKEDLPTTTIEGTVINTGSKEPIEGVRVILTDGIGVRDNFFGSSTSTGTGKQVETYTDTNGKFRISIDGEDPHLYLIKEKYEFVFFTYGTSDGFKVYSPSYNYTNEVLELWADAYFNPIFKGTNSDISDSICFDEVGYKISLGDLRYSHRYCPIGNGPHRFSNWEKGGLKGVGDKYFGYWMIFQIHGIWHERIDSVFIKSFTTYTDTIYY